MADESEAKSMEVAYKYYPFGEVRGSNPLPSAWNSKDKGSYIGLSKNSLRVHYKGPSKSSRDASCARTNYHIPVACGLYYYEVKICSKAKEGSFSIGFGPKKASIERLPGWEDCSYGFHTDDGQAYNSNTAREGYGRKVGAGDVVGCGLDFVKKNVFYTVNGANCGLAHTNLHLNKDTRIFPMIGLTLSSDAAEANFGDRKFVFEIDALHEARKKQFCAQSFGFQLGEEHAMAVAGMRTMVLSYLTTHGYLDTARNMAHGAGNRLHENSAFDQNRREIVELILGGQISSALAAISDSYPQVLTEKSELSFRLHCQQFIEMVKQVDDGRGRIAVTPYNRQQASTASAGGDMWGTSSTGVSNQRPGRVRATTGSDHSPPLPASGDGVMDEDRLTLPSLNGHSKSTDSGGDHGGEAESVLSHPTACASPRNGGSDTSMEVDVVGLDDSDDASVVREMPMDDGDGAAVPTGGVQAATSSSGPQLAGSSDECKGSDDPNGDDSMNRILEYGVSLQKEFDDLLVVRVHLDEQKRVAESLRTLVKDAFSLIAYEDLSKSPKQHLLDQSHRDDLSLEVNSAILESQKIMPVSTLELTTRHLRYCLQTNADNGTIPVFPLAVDDFSKGSLKEFTETETKPES